MSAIWSSRLRSQEDFSLASVVPDSLPTGLLYQSQATAPVAEGDLSKIINAAQSRNRVESITGMLIYDEGRFLQWLEGPTEGLQRVWRSISDDPRHTDIELLGQYPPHARIFGNFHMALGRRHVNEWWSGESEINLPPNVINILCGSPTAAPLMLAQMVATSAAQSQPRATPVSILTASERLSLQTLVKDVIVANLVSRHAADASRTVATVDPKALALAKLLVATDANEALALIDRLRGDGRSLTQLCAGLLEPTARALGELWQQDVCTEFEVTMALCRLQGALRRSSFDQPYVHVLAHSAPLGRSILVAPSPHETHVLGSAIASEMFWRAGWDVSCEFPSSDAALGKLLHDRWFDVLELSLSGVFTREDRLPALAETIRAAHQHSLNPALKVIVDGRVFYERPNAFAEVGADGSSASAQSLVSTAQQHRNR